MTKCRLLTRPTWGLLAKKPSWLRCTITATLTTEALEAATSWLGVAEANCARGSTTEDAITLTLISLSIIVWGTLAETTTATKDAICVIWLHFKINYH